MRTANIVNGICMEVHLEPIKKLFEFVMITSFWVCHNEFNGADPEIFPGGGVQL